MKNLTAIALEDCWLAFANEQVLALQIANLLDMSVDYQGMRCPIYDIQSLLTDTALTHARYQAIVATKTVSLALSCKQVKALPPTLIWFEIQKYCLPKVALTNQVAFFAGKPVYQVTAEALIRWIDTQVDVRSGLVSVI